ncbi:MAG: hypothetical protein KAV87_02515, partial [Desulfobacteraceae bacterium]|nr:hypothetical protein [Desulfobacteraceae bacterium]
MGEGVTGYWSERSVDPAGRDMQFQAWPGKKMKKAYFSDPFILWTLRGWAEGWLMFYEKSCEKVRNELFKSCLAEMLVANALFRQYQNTDWTGTNIMFFRNKGEIDFLIKKD